MAKKQTREQLGVKAGDKIILKGKVTFARLDKVVTGEALAKENERRAKLNMLPTKEFRSVTIEDPEVVQGQGTPLAMYYGQSVYQSKSNGKNTMSFESKSLYPPQYGHMQDGKIVQIPDPQRNPAQGQEIYLMISAFAPKGFNNLGSTFDAIVFGEGEIKFYENNNALSGFGEALNMPVETLPTNGQPETQSQPEPEPVTANGFGQGTQGGFGGAPVGQPNSFGQAQGGASNPFGVQDNDLAGGNNGQRANNPFA